MKIRCTAGCRRIMLSLSLGVSGSYSAVAVDYFVNDADPAGDLFCTAPGNGANDGLSPLTPLASPHAVFTRYTVSTGDTVFVDSGFYPLQDDLEVPDTGPGNPASGSWLRLVGTGRSVLDRQAAGGSACCLRIRQDCTRVEGLSFRQAGVGIEIVAETCRNARLEGVTVSDLSDAGIVIQPDPADGGVDTYAIRNTLIYNTRNGILIQSGEGFHRANVTVENTTVSAFNGVGVACGGAAGGTVLRHSILAVKGAGACLSVAREGALAHSEFNNLYPYGGARLAVFAAEDATRLIDTLAAWRSETGFDRFSLSRDPLFVHPDAGDFHLRSRGGSLHDGEWVADWATSPCVDAGDPAAPPGDESEPNGNRLNLGAYGGTAAASRSEAGRILALVAPLPGESSAGGVRVAWSATGDAWAAADTVRVEWALPGEGGVTAWTPVPDAAALPRTGEFLWQPPPDVSATYALRVVCNADPAVMVQTEQGVDVTRKAATYYVNDSQTAGDQFCTAPGNDAHTGTAPDRPLASLPAVLQRFTLGPGDTVRVDAGDYLLTSNAVLDARHRGKPEEPVRLIGVRGATRFVRSQDGTNRCCLEVAADHIEIDGLTCEEAETGIRVDTAQARHVRLIANAVKKNSGYGIVLAPSLTFQGGTFQLLQNVVVQNGHGLYVKGSPDNQPGQAVFLIENNTVQNAGNGIEVLNRHISDPRATVLKNNIVVAPHAAAACVTLLSGARLYADYNTLHATNGAAVGTWADQSEARAETLAEWRTMTGGQDAHSLARDPLFTAPSQGDYRLAAGSPCVDAGAVSYWMAGALDAGGAMRVAGVNADAGAFEVNVRLAVRVLLQGPYIQMAEPPHLMTTALSQVGFLPLRSPYADAPRTVDAVPSNVTDWVLVQFRRSPEAPPILSYSAFLRQDGWLVDERGSTELAVNLAVADACHVGIKHRNHLAALSAVPLQFGGQPVVYDFTVAADRFFGGAMACAALESSAGPVFALRTGDLDGDGRALPADAAMCGSAALASPAYHRADVNLDGAVDTVDTLLVQQSVNAAAESPFPQPETRLTATLRITPPRATVVPNAHVTFNCELRDAMSVSTTAAGVLSEPAPVVWQLVPGSSNATLTGIAGTSQALYTAGAASGMPDRIVAWDGNGVSGRALVNVADTQTVAAAGQALIVAGRTSSGDPLWPATDYLADTAYSTLRYRGFSDDTLHYLSPVLEGDVDEVSTFASVAHAFTNTVSGADRLFVYLVDHGGLSSGSGYFRLNGDETVTAAQLDAWLDALQDRDQTPVTVLLDFCYAGSFLPALGYTGTASRIVIAACGTNEPSYFVSGGLVSFSGAFFSGVMLGYDVNACYQMAQNAMSTYQTAVLDDDKDGASTAADGAVAALITLGPTFAAAADVPLIGEVCGNQVLSDGTSAQLWIGSVTAPAPLTDVWCQIVPPGHEPNPDNPVITLPRLDLAYDDVSGRFLVTYDGFTVPGTYAVTFYVRDSENGVSVPRTAYVAQLGYADRVILVAGGDTNSVAWPAIRALTGQAYDTLRLRLFTPDRIRLLAPEAWMDADGDGSNDVAAVAGTNSLREAISGWAVTNDTDRLALYLIGEGTNGTFRLSGAGESLETQALAAWLGAYQRTNPVPVTALFDFSGAGAFLSALADPGLADNYPAATRTVVASTHAAREALFANGGTVSFSHYFLSGVAAGKTVGQAYTDARRAIRRISGGVRQRAQIDDNLNGQPNEKEIEGSLADETYLGSAFVTGADVPVIGQVMPPVAEPGGAVTLWAAGVSSMYALSNVWCVVTPPGQSGTGDLTRVDLLWDTTLGRYQAVWEGFTLPGAYILTFFAMDMTGQVSEPLQSEILLADAYEPDGDAAHGATYLGAPQTHTLHTAADEDWMRVYLLPDYVYEVEVYHLSERLDSVLVLYRELPDGGIEVVEAYDDEDADAGEFALITYPEEGWYWVRVLPYTAGTNTVGAYELSIDIPAAAGTGTLIVLGVDDVDVSALPAGAYASVSGFSSKPFNGAKNITFAGLSYGTYRVEVPFPAYHIAREDPLYPGQVQSLTNLFYANPREVVIAGSWCMAGFEFLSTVAVTSAVVRDAYTGAFLPNARFAFVATSGALTGAVAEGSVMLTAYADLWLSGADGRAPTNILLGACGWDLVLSLDGYVTNTISHAVSNLAAGAAVSLGTLGLVPEDTNANTVADAWEALYFPNGFVPSADEDGDGSNNIAEYLCGTLPDDPASVLCVLAAQHDAGGATLQWRVAPGRCYTVEASSTPSGIGTVYGPWEAGPGQSVMQWTDPDSPSHAARFYRVKLQHMQP